MGSHTHFNSLTNTGSIRYSGARPIGDTWIGRHGKK